MIARRRWLALIVAAPGILAASGCEWFTEFKRTPSLWTWEVVSAKDSLKPSRGNPQNSVPVTGAVVAGFQVSHAALPATIDSMAGIPNPVAVSDTSLVNGRKYYQINCAVCHGEKGMGDGPATKFGMPGISLVTDVTRGRSDGYVFGMIRNGRGLMPSYNRIEEEDRWDVVNYLRGLQGALGRTVPTGALAAPGITGNSVPGSTRTAPTRPAPFMKPGMTGRAAEPVAQTQSVGHDTLQSRGDSAAAGKQR